MYLAIEGLSKVRENSRGWAHWYDDS